MPNPCGTTGVAVPAAANTAVTFGNFQSGTYLYCNNPEELLNAGCLGDADLGNRYLLWAYVSGPCQTWYEHLNATGSTIGYGVQLYNAGAFRVRVDVTNVGFGLDATSPWLQFFGGSSGAGGAVGTFQLPPGGVLWLQRNDTAIPDGSIFNGAVRFSVWGGSVYAFWYAYRDFGHIDGTAAYIGWVTSTDPDGADEGRVYKGIAAGGTFFETARLGYRVSELLAAPAVWDSHRCGDGSNDMQDFLVPTGGPSDPAPVTVSCGDSPQANLGNWGVQYAYTLDVTNDTGVARTIHLQLSQLSGGAAQSQVIVDTPVGAGGCLIGGDRPTWDFYDFVVASGQAAQVQWQVILGASSWGGLTNSVAVT